MQGPSRRGSSLTKAGSTGCRVHPQRETPRARERLRSRVKKYSFLQGLLCLIGLSAVHGLSNHSPIIFGRANNPKCANSPARLPFVQVFIRGSCIASDVEEVLISSLSQRSPLCWTAISELRRASKDTNRSDSKWNVWLNFTNGSS